jgi:hypothetical protein
METVKMKNTIRFRPGIHYGIGDILVLTDGTDLNLYTVKDMQPGNEEGQPCDLTLADTSHGVIKTSAGHAASDFDVAGDGRMLVGVIYGDEIVGITNKNTIVRIEEKDIVATEVTSRILRRDANKDPQPYGYTGCLDDYSGRSGSMGIGEHADSFIQGMRLVHLEPEIKGDENAYSIYINTGANCIADFADFKIAQAYGISLRYFLDGNMDQRKIFLRTLETNMQTTIDTQNKYSVFDDNRCSVLDDVYQEIKSTEIADKMTTLHWIPALQLRPAFVKKLFPYRTPDGDVTLAFYASNKKDAEMAAIPGSSNNPTPVYEYADAQIITQVTKLPRGVSTKEAAWLNDFNRDAKAHGYNKLQDMESALQILRKSFNIDSKNQYDASVVKHYSESMTAEKMVMDIVDGLVPGERKIDCSTDSMLQKILPQILIRERLSRIWYKRDENNNDMISVPYPHVSEGNDIASVSLDFDVSATSIGSAAKVAANNIAALLNASIPLDGDDYRCEVWVITEDDERVQFDIAGYIHSGREEDLQIYHDDRESSNFGMNP